MSSNSSFSSEILPIKLNGKNYQRFRINPEIDKKIGNRISWRLSDRAEGRIVIFDSNTGCFWALGKPEINLPLDSSSWQVYFNPVLVQLHDDLGDAQYKIEEVENTPIITTNIESELAVQALKFSEQLRPEILFSTNNINVETDVNYWSEQFEFNNIINPAIAVNLKTRIIYKKDLQDFFKNHPQNSDPEKFLIDLQVKPLDSGGTATIVRLAKTLGERRNELITKASSPVTQDKLLKGADEELIVSIRFGKKGALKGALYDYPLRALKPLITAETSYLFNAKYGDLLKHTKLTYAHRQDLVEGFTGDINYRLESFMIQSHLTIDSENYCNLFIPFKYELENTKLMFGNSVTSIKKYSLKGLREGGVFKRHPDFEDADRKIRLGIIKPHNLKVGDFREQLEKQLKLYKFDLRLPEECKKNYNIDDLEGPDSRAKLEELINDLLEEPIDLVLAFLPGSEEKDDDNDNELYELVKKHLLRRNAASQVVYEDTIVGTDPSKYSNILNNITPGILGKLGNLPFVLAEPLEMAEAFVGLDISRFPHENRSGSRNVCASVRLYGRHGEFIRYRLDDSLIEGEEIPRQVLEDFFPSDQFKNKKVLVYRDGPFRGDEVEHLFARAKAIKSQFILVESIKTGVPRLYNFNNGILGQPTRGLALKVSDREVILVTTNVPEKIGVPRPLRLRIHEDGEQASLEQLIETTLKLTLLHYGSLKDPRLPIPLYASDAIAYRRLQGIYPTNPEGDRQFWL